METPQQLADRTGKVVTTWAPGSDQLARVSPEDYWLRFGLTPPPEPARLVAVYEPGAPVGLGESLRSYRVKVGPRPGGEFPYTLEGARGAVYMLHRVGYRSGRSLERLAILSATGYKRIKGNSWLTDADGYLRLDG